MNLLDRARKILGGLGSPEPSAPQYYRVRCPEGHLVRGQRTEGYQAIRCPACGEGLFVLPRSPLPEPPAPAVDRPKLRPMAPERQPEPDEPIRWTDAPPQVVPGGGEPAPDVEIPWEEPTEPTAAPAAAGAPTTAPAVNPTDDAARPRKRAPRPAGAGSTPAGAPARSRPRRPAPDEPRPQIELPPRPSLGQRLRRHRHALTIGGVVLFVVATIGFRMYQRRWESLPQVAEANRVEGLRALESGVFDVARQKLAIAAGALEDLGDPDAAQVRQAAGEAAIFADLASLSLEEMVEQVATRPPGEGQRWFEDLHRGRSILLDAHLETAPGGGLTLDYRVFAGAKRGWIDLTGFRLFDGKSPGDPVTFGARLDAISLGEDGSWRVVFEPDSGVYLSTPEGWEALGALGWPPPDVPLEDLR